MVKKNQRIKTGDKVYLTKEAEIRIGSYNLQRLTNPYEPFKVTKTERDGYIIRVDMREANSYKGPRRLYKQELILVTPQMEAIKDKLEAMNNEVPSNNEQETVHEDTNTNAQH